MLLVILMEDGEIVMLVLMLIVLFMMLYQLTYKGSPLIHYY